MTLFPSPGVVSPVPVPSAEYFPALAVVSPVPSSPAIRSRSLAIKLRGHHSTRGAPNPPPKKTSRAIFGLTTQPLLRCFKRRDNAFNVTSETADRSTKRSCCLNPTRPRHNAHHAPGFRGCVSHLCANASSKSFAVGQCSFSEPFSQPSSASASSTVGTPRIRASSRSSSATISPTIALAPPGSHRVAATCAAATWVKPTSRVNVDEAAAAAALSSRALASFAEAFFELCFELFPVFFPFSLATPASLALGPSSLAVSPPPSPPASLEPSPEEPDELESPSCSPSRSPELLESSSLSLSLASPVSGRRQSAHSSAYASAASVSCGVAFVHCNANRNASATSFSNSATRISAVVTTKSPPPTSRRSFLKLTRASSFNFVSFERYCLDLTVLNCVAFA
mmetsp:Transcript_41/g.129  ORF Transcript_41/g.129 Transcript_41/m.129 type:complete len:396 (-) Transcript_41:1309-2496(-)